MTSTIQRPDRHAAADLEASPRGGDRFVASGLLLLALLLVAMQVVHGVLIPPVAVPAVIYAVLAAAVARSRARWPLIVALVLPVLHIVGSIPFLVPALSHPESTASFLPEALIVITSIAVVAGAIVALRSAGPRSRRRIGASAGLAAVAAAALSLTAAAGVAADLREADDVAVQAVGTQYPERIDVPAHAGALWIDNQDPYRHTFVIEGTEVHAEVPGSSAARVPIDLAPGSYRYFCDVPGHETMEGTIVAS